MSAEIQAPELVEPLIAEFAHDEHRLAQLEYRYEKLRSSNANAARHMARIEQEFERSQDSEERVQLRVVLGRQRELARARAEELGWLEKELEPLRAERERIQEAAREGLPEVLARYESAREGLKAAASATAKARAEAMVAARELRALRSKAGAMSATEAPLSVRVGDHDTRYGDVGFWIQWTAGGNWK